MHCEWIRRISFFRWFFGYLYIKKIVRSPFLGWCLKYFGSKFTDSRIPGLKGDSPFLILKFFSFCMQMLFHMNSYVFSITFFVSHFWFLLALIGHCDSLMLRFFLSNFRHWHWKILSRWHPFFLLWLISLIWLSKNFHCPLSLHQIHSPPTIQFLIDCLPWLYCTTSLNLYLTMDLYNLKPSSCCTSIFTYEFTYLQIATLYLRIHLLIPTNCCIPIWTTLYLWIYLQKVTYQFIQCCTYKFIYKHELWACYFRHMPSCGWE